MDQKHGQTAEKINKWKNVFCLLEMKEITKGGKNHELDINEPIRYGAISPQPTCVLNKKKKRKIDETQTRSDKR